MPTRVTLCSVSQSASAARSALIVANLRLCTCQPPSGLGTRTQATSDAFAMSRPAARCTTVSIVMTLLLGRRLPGWPAGVGAESNRAFDSRARSNTPGHQPQLPRPVPQRARRTKLSQHQTQERDVKTRPGTAGIFSPPGRPEGPDRSVELRVRPAVASGCDDLPIVHGGWDSPGDFGVQRGAQRRQVQVAVDPAELRAGREHAGGAPAQ